MNKLIRISRSLSQSMYPFTNTLPVLRRNRSNVHMGISDKREVQKAGGRIWSQFGNARHDNAVMVPGDSNLLNEVPAGPNNHRKPGGRTDNTTIICRFEALAVDR